MAEKKQWNIRVEDQLIDRLNTLAPRAGFSSGNEFAAAALDAFAETLADFMVELRKVEEGAVRRQRDDFLAKIRQMHVSESDDDSRGKPRRK